MAASENYGPAFARLAKSRFRSRFHLSESDREYIEKKRHGDDTAALRGFHSHTPCSSQSAQRWKADPHARTSGFHRATRNSDLLLKLPREVEESTARRSNQLRQAASNSRFSDGVDL